MDAKAQKAGTYSARRERLAQQLHAATGQVTLRKKNSNLFRDRDRASKPRLDVHDFNHVLQVDAQSGWADAEGMTSYEALVLSTLACGTMPAVVPQLKTITLGGAVAGVGIEATSFRHGLVHQSVLEMDILAGDGKVYLCTPQNEYRDLFFGFPNSYGTLGYALRVRTRTIPVKKFVRIEHTRFGDPSEYFRGLQVLCDSGADFVDGVVFGPEDLYLTAGTFVDDAPFVSDYTFEHIYYRSIRDRKSDYLTAHDFLWRWDTDWFWCSKNFGVQNALVRRLAGKARLNSRTYTRVMRWNSRWKLTQRLDALFGVKRESVIQDVDIPIGRAAEFLAFFQREIGITADMDLPDPQSGCAGAVSPLSAESIHDLCQFRILGCREVEEIATSGTLQQACRTQGRGTRRNQVLVLGQLLLAREIRRHLRRGGLPPAKVQVRSAESTA